MIRAMRLRFAAGLLVLVTALSASAQGFPDWSVRQQGDRLVYTFDRDRETKVIIGKTLKTGARSRASLLSSSLSGPELGFRITRAGEITEASAPDGALRAMSVGKTGSNKDGVLVSTLCPGAGEQYRIVHVVGAAEMLKDKNISREASGIAMRACLGRLKLKPPQDRASASAAESKSRSETRGVPRADEIAGVWSSTSYGITGAGFYGMTERFIVTFTDGSATTDVNGVFHQGISKSRQAEPGRWGRWRKSGNVIEVMIGDDESFERRAGVFRVLPGKDGQTLDRCFSHMMSAGNIAFGGNSTATSASDFCFRPDGTLEHGTATAVSGGNDYSGKGSMYAGGGSSEQSGSYRIEGNLIQLTWPNGTEETRAFGFLSKDHGAILIGDTRHQQ